MLHHRVVAAIAHPLQIVIGSAIKIVHSCPIKAAQYLQQLCRSIEHCRHPVYVIHQCRQLVVTGPIHTEINIRNTSSPLSVEAGCNWRFCTKTYTDKKQDIRSMCAFPEFPN